MIKLKLTSYFDAVRLAGTCASLLLLAAAVRLGGWIKEGSEESSGPVGGQDVCRLGTQLETPSAYAFNITALRRRVQQDYGTDNSSRTPCTAGPSSRLLATENGILAQRTGRGHQVFEERGRTSYFFPMAVRTSAAASSSNFPHPSSFMLARRTTEGRDAALIHNNGLQIKTGMWLAFIAKCQPLDALVARPQKITSY